MAGKLRVALVFGGVSVEHEVSLSSARSVLSAIDRSRFEVLPVGITRDGRWLAGPRSLEVLEAGGRQSEGARRCALLAEPNIAGLRVQDGSGAAAKQSHIPVDVVFPLIHGRHGEDGSLQGLLEMAGIPYVGCGVLASALCMDKETTKRLLQRSSLPVVESVCLTDRRWERDWKTLERQVADTVGYPCFVKPANGGSSVGITKVGKAGELRCALEEANRYDCKLLVERAVEAREIEVSVLGNEDPRASVPGEIEPASEFYDYEAKYVDESSRLHVPAPLTRVQSEQVRRLALEAFRALGCEGMARVDFLLDRRGGALYVSEVNTVPGFTPISMYPKLWQASGLAYPRLIERLIELARARHRRNASLITSYERRARSVP